MEYHLRMMFCHKLPLFGARRRTKITILLSFVFCVIILGSINAESLLESNLYLTQDQRQEYRTPTNVPTPADNLQTPERIELGKILFFDPRLSGSGAVGCVSCHNPRLAWTDGLQTGLGRNEKRMDRNSMSIVNVAFYQTSHWDGRTNTLEEASVGAMVRAMANPNHETVDEKFSQIKGYYPLVEKAYPGEKFDHVLIGKALASFMRDLVSRNAPFDGWVDGNEMAISESAKRGVSVFIGKGNCVACHQGFNFSDDGFHNIGLTDNDPGRYRVTNLPVNKGAFRTPGLRDVAMTPPYMHNGVYNTLEEVIEHYDRGGDRKENLDPNIKPLKLTPLEKNDLVAFMKTLTGEPVHQNMPELPQ